MTHHITVRHDTNKAKLTQHMALTLKEDGHFTVSAANGEPSNRMEWAIASLDGFFPGYVVSHSSIEHAQGKGGGTVTLITKRVWIQKGE